MLMDNLILHAEPTGMGYIRTWTKPHRVRYLVSMAHVAASIPSMYRMPSAHGLTLDEVKHIHSALIMEATTHKPIGEFG